MREHPIHQLLDISLEKVTNMIDTQKIVGQPITIDANRTIIPISKVSFGFGTGGSEFSTKVPKKSALFTSEQSEDLFPFGGGSGGGVSIKPTAFLVIEKEKVSVVYPQRSEKVYDKLFDFISQFISKEQWKNVFFKVDNGTLS